MKPVYDLFGQEIHRDSKVLYTTNSGVFGLNYGVVVDIYETGARRGYGSGARLKIRPLDDDGTLKTKNKWDAVEQKFYPTDILVQPSIIDHSTHKVYVL